MDFNNKELENIVENNRNINLLLEKLQEMENKLGEIKEELENAE